LKKRSDTVAVGSGQLDGFRDVLIKTEPVAQGNIRFALKITDSPLLSLRPRADGEEKMCLATAVRRNRQFEMRITPAIIAQINLREPVQPGIESDRPRRHHAPRNSGCRWRSVRCE